MIRVEENLGWIYKRVLQRWRFLIQKNPRLEVDDIVNSVVVRLLRNTTFDSSKGSETTYITKVVDTVALECIAKNLSEFTTINKFSSSQRVLKLTRQPLNDDAIGYPNHAERLEQTEELENLMKLTEKLSKKEQHVLRLRMNGVRYDKIGKTMGFTKEYARQVYNSALFHLRYYADIGFDSISSA